MPAYFQCSRFAGLNEKGYGENMNRWWILGGIILLVLITGAGFLMLRLKRTPQNQTIANKVADVAENNLSQFIQADWIDLSKIASISKFRSGMGHDYSAGSGESCRNMKHYYNLAATFERGHGWSPGDPPPPAPKPSEAIAIYSPVDGEIAAFEEQNVDFGLTIRITPDSQPKFSITLYHIFPRDDLKPGMAVKAGEQIGQIRTDQNTDIAIEYGPPYSRHYVSYFEVVPDLIFAKYQARGVTDREQMIITKEARDAKPLECRNGSFAQHYENQPDFDEVVYINGYIRPQQ